MKQTQFRIFGPGRLQLWDGWQLNEFDAWVELLNTCGEKHEVSGPYVSRIAALIDQGYYILKVNP